MNITASCWQKTLRMKLQLSKHHVFNVFNEQVTLNMKVHILTFLFLFISSILVLRYKALILFEPHPTWLYSGRMGGLSRING